MIYVVNPYSPQEDHPTVDILEVRYLQVMRFVANNFGSGGKREWLYSPILHCHEMAKRFDLPTSFDFWQDYDRHMLHLSEELWILMMPGWKTSTGVRAEAGYMGRTLAKPIRFFMLDGTETKPELDDPISYWLLDVMREEADRT